MDKLRSDAYSIIKASIEAGHPVPDESGFRATKAALDLVSELTEKDLVVFLLSGGGSALFELPFSLSAATVRTDRPMLRVVMLTETR